MKSIYFRFIAFLLLLTFSIHQVAFAYPVSATQHAEAISGIASSAFVLLAMTVVGSPHSSLVKSNGMTQAEAATIQSRAAVSSLASVLSTLSSSFILLLKPDPAGGGDLGPPGGPPQEEERYVELGHRSGDR